jgi:chitin synthase
MYMICAILWSLMFALSAGLSISTLLIGKVNIAVIIILFGLSVGLLFVAAFFHGEIIVVLSNFVQYFLVAPVFLVIFPVYSICNLHDISWGTKGISEAAEIVRDDVNDSVNDINERVRARLRRIAKLRDAEKLHKNAQQERFGRFRTYVLLTWIFSQGLYVSFILSANQATNSNRIGTLFLEIMFAIVALTNFIRFTGSMLYLTIHNVTKKRKVPAYPAAPTTTNNK